LRDTSLRRLRRAATPRKGPALLPGSVSPTRLPPPPPPTNRSARVDPPAAVPARRHRLLLPRVRPTPPEPATLPGLQHLRRPPGTRRNLPLLQRDHPHQRPPRQRHLTTTTSLGMIAPPKLNPTPTRSLHTGEPVVPSSWRATPSRPARSQRDSVQSGSRLSQQGQAEPTRPGTRERKGGPLRVPFIITLSGARSVPCSPSLVKPYEG
jgi:hypothetical protein